MATGAINTGTGGPDTDVNRLEWDLPGGSADGPPPAPSAVMACLGVVQDTEPALRRVARRFDLPAEAEDARRVVTELNSACERVAQTHTFDKGMGIAAPEIGNDRAAAIVRTPDGEAITLFNPTIIESCGDVDEQYEAACRSSTSAARYRVPMSSMSSTRRSTAGRRSLCSNSASRAWSRTKSTTCTARSTPTGCATGSCRSRWSSTAAPGRPGSTDVPPLTGPGGRVLLEAEGGA